MITVFRLLQIFILGTFFLTFIIYCIKEFVFNRNEKFASKIKSIVGNSFLYLAFPILIFSGLYLFMNHVEVLSLKDGKYAHNEYVMFNKFKINDSISISVFSKSGWGGKKYFYNNLDKDVCLEPKTYSVSGHCFGKEKPIIPIKKKSGTVVPKFPNFYFKDFPPKMSSKYFYDTFYRVVYDDSK